MGLIMTLRLRKKDKSITDFMTTKRVKWMDKMDFRPTAGVERGMQLPKRKEDTSLKSIQKCVNFIEEKIGMKSWAENWIFLIGENKFI